MIPTEPRWVLAPNPSLMTLDGTRTFIVGRREPVIIDPGPDIDDHVERVIQALDSARPVAIVLTHFHDDHSGATARIVRRTGATVASGGPVGSAPSHVPVDRYLAPGDLIQTDQGTLTVIPTPGHAPEHIALLWTGDPARGGALFVGDLLMGLGDTTFVGCPEGDVASYLRSLDRIEALRCAVHYPAHGPALPGGGAIRRHREHRLGRVDQIRSLLALYPDADADRLVDLAYGPSLDPRLRTAAIASVESVARYLCTVI